MPLPLIVAERLVALLLRFDPLLDIELLDLTEAGVQRPHDLTADIEVVYIQFCGQRIIR